MRGTKFMQTRFQQERTALIFSSFAPICGEMNKRRREANGIDFPRPGGALGAHCKEMIKIYICMRAAAYFASSHSSLIVSFCGRRSEKEKQGKENARCEKERERKTTFVLSPPHCRQCRVAGLGMNKKIPANLRLVYAIVSAQKNMGQQSCQAEGDVLLLLFCERPRRDQNKSKAAPEPILPFTPWGNSRLCALE